MAITYLANQKIYNFAGSSITIFDGTYTWTRTIVSATERSLFETIDGINAYFIFNPPSGWQSGEFIPFIDMNNHENPTIVNYNDLTEIGQNIDITVDGNLLFQYGLGCFNKEQEILQTFTQLNNATFPYWGAFRLPNEVIREIKGVWMNNGYTKRTPIKTKRKGITFVSYYRIYNTKYKAINGFRYQYKVQEKDMQAFDLFIDISQNSLLEFNNDVCCGDGYSYYLSTHDSINLSEQKDFLSLTLVSLDLYKSGDFYEV